MLKLHLGCGDKDLKGYTGVDLADTPAVKVRADVKKLPFEDNSAEVIYASHVFEYFDNCCKLEDGSTEAANVLKEWYRVLAHGGVLRLAVPSFDDIVKVYLKHRNLKKGGGVTGPIYGHWPIPGTDMKVRHQALYDYPYLYELLTAAGFHHVRTWDWRKVFIGENKGFDDYSQAYIPHMDTENGILISLNVEADK